MISPTLLALSFVLCVAPAGARGARLQAAAYHDCNRNGIEDSIDIALGSSADADGDGVPDECEDAAS